MNATRPFRRILTLTLVTIFLVGCSGVQAVAPTPTPSPVLLAESIAQQYASAFEARDADKFFSLHSDDALYMGYGVGNSRGATKIKLYVQELQALFRYVESFQVKITSYIVSADGRFVVLQGSYTDWGKNGYPATVPIVVIVEIRDGKIVQETAYYDGSPFKK